MEAQHTRKGKAMEKVKVSVVTVERSGKPNDMGFITGGEQSFVLPGADYNKTVQTLREAGFRALNYIDEALNK